MRAFLSIILLLVSVVCSLKSGGDVAGSWIAHFEEHITRCMCQAKINDKLAYYFTTKFDCTGDEKFGCYVRCLFMKKGLMDYNGALVKSMWVNTWPKVTSAIYDKCLGAICDDTDSCAVAADMWECVRDYSFSA